METSNFATSISVVTDLIKTLREQGINGNALLRAIGEKVLDEELFSKAQRPNVLKAVNKAMGTSYTMTKIKAAMREEVSAPSTKQPKAALHVDELHGKAELKSEPKPPADFTTTPEEEQVLLEKLARIEANTDVRRAIVFSDFISLSAPQHKGEMDTLIEQAVAQGLVEDRIPETVMIIMLRNAELAEKFDTYLNALQERAVKTATHTHEQLTAVADHAHTGSDQENTMTTAPASAEAKDDIPPSLVSRFKPEIRQNILDTLSSQATQEPTTMNATDLKALLTKINVADDKALPPVMVEFFKKHPDLKASWHSVVGHDSVTIADLEKWVAQDTAGSTNFTLFANAKYNELNPPTQPTITERVLTTLRGDRKEGFSSGVIAAGAALIGGGVEMAVRGNLSVGSGLGVALGATAGYFAANAAEDIMESETGRYLLAGSIGLVAGGLGSRAGGLIQNALLKEAEDAQQSDDVIVQAVPTVAAPQPQPTLSAPAFSGLFR